MKITLNLDDEATQMIVVLQATTGASSPGATFRNAMIVYHWLWEQVGAGKRLAVIERNGDVRELDLRKWQVKEPN